MTSTDATPGGSEPEEGVGVEISRVEAQMSELLREAHDLRTQLRDEGPMDRADASGLIAQAEQLEALARGLDRRRASLLQKLEGPG